MFKARSIGTVHGQDVMAGGSMSEKIKISERIVSELHEIYCAVIGKGISFYNN